MKVLDVGCGPGRLSLPVARAVGESGQVVAMDLQPEMLQRVERRAAAAGLRNVRTLLAAAGHSRLPPGSFDMVLLSYVLGEIPRALRLVALEEISAVLRPHGRLIVIEGLTDPHRQRIETVRKLAEQANLRLESASGWLNKVITFVAANSD